LTEIGKSCYADLKTLVASKKIQENNKLATHDHSISDMDEAPYRRLRKTPAYEKLQVGHPEQIVETDFLYFYGINWHSKVSLVHSKIKNVDMVVKEFSPKDPLLKATHRFLNEKYVNVRERLLKGEKF
jgi:hypothetical protein